MLKIEATTKFFEEDFTMKNLWEDNKVILEETVRKIEQKLGEGNTAEVFFLGENEDLCIKLMKNEPDIPFRVSLLEEMKFQEALYGIDEEVLSPKPYLIAEFQDGDFMTKFLLMRRLHACSVEDILNGKAEIPENFDLNEFRRKLKNFLNKMHDKNIYHRDLQSGNIMMDAKGNPYVIDFGRSGSAFGDESPYDQTQGGQRMLFPEDHGSLSEVCLRLRNFLLTKRVKPVIVNEDTPQQGGTL